MLLAIKASFCLSLYILSEFNTLRNFCNKYSTEPTPQHDTNMTWPDPPIKYCSLQFTKLKDLNKKKSKLTDFLQYISKLSYTNLLMINNKMILIVNLY